MFENILEYSLKSYNLIIKNFLIGSVEDNITAQGASAQSAYNLTKMNNFVTNIDVSSDGVKLPLISNENYDITGVEITVWNLNLSNTLKVYVADSNAINGSNLDTILPNNKKTYLARNSNQYIIK